MNDPFESDPFEIGDPGTTTIVRPKKAESTEQEPSKIPRFHVILWDSGDHSYDYVRTMLRDLFGHTKETCQKMAETVDNEGRVVVLTTTQEHAELKRDQIHAYGKDDYIQGCSGAMWATIEEAP